MQEDYFGNKAWHCRPEFYRAIAPVVSSDLIYPGLSPYFKIITNDILVILNVTTELNQYYPSLRSWPIECKNSIISSVFTKLIENGAPSFPQISCIINLNPVEHIILFLTALHNRPSLFVQEFCSYKDVMNDINNLIESHIQDFCQETIWKIRDQYFLIGEALIENTRIFCEDHERKALELFEYFFRSSRMISSIKNEPFQVNKNDTTFISNLFCWIGQVHFDFIKEIPNSLEKHLPVDILYDFANCDFKDISKKFNNLTVGSPDQYFCEKLQSIPEILCDKNTLEKSDPNFFEMIKFGPNFNEELRVDSKLLHFRLYKITECFGATDHFLKGLIQQSL